MHEYSLHIHTCMSIDYIHYIYKNIYMHEYRLYIYIHIEKQTTCIAYIHIHVRVLTKYRLHRHTCKKTDYTYIHA